MKKTAKNKLVTAKTSKTKSSGIPQVIDNISAKLEGSPLPLLDGHDRSAVSVGLKNREVAERLVVATDQNTIKGCVDDLVNGVLYGWCFDSSRISWECAVEVFVDGTKVADAIANIFRQDLATANIGNGSHAFEVLLPKNLFDNSVREILVRLDGQSYLYNPHPNRRFNSIPTAVEDFAALVHDDYQALFDAGFYQRQLGYLVPDPINHYLEYGWKLNFNPHPLFDSQYYVALYSAEIKTNPLHHFLTVGKFREYEVHPLFDVLAYNNKRPDVRQAAIHPVFHYLQFGHRERVAVSRFFDEALYEKECPGVRDLGFIPLLHYLSYGWREGRRPNAQFDPNLYIKLNFALAETAFIDPFTHFLRATLLRRETQTSKALRRLEQPRVSIIILNLSKTITTLLCLHEILKSNDLSAVEIIVLDNGSQEDQFQLLCEMACGTVILRVSRNLGFGEGNNIAVDKARGEYLLFLNNDAFVQGDWLSTLMGAIGKSDNIGAVGPKLIFPDGRLQEAGAFISADGTAIQRGKNLDPSAECFNRAGEVDYISAAALMVRADLFRKVLGFDLCWDPAYYEDADLCLKLKLLGYSTYYVPEVEVVHIENGTSSDPQLNLGLGNIVEINRLKFISRWQTFLSDGDESIRSELFNRVCGETPLTARPQAALYSPYPLIPGGGERYFLTLASELNDQFDVTLFVPDGCSSVRIATMARELDLDVAGLRVRRWDDRSRHGPFSLFVCMGNQILPPVEGIGKINIFHCQFPFPMEASHYTRDWGNLEDYSCIIVNSAFTKKYVENRAQRVGLNCPPVHIVYPPVPAVELAGQSVKPADGVLRILNVGRFAPGGHCKRQDVMIDIFRELRKKFPNARLELAGSVGVGAESRVYLADLRKKSRDLPVRFHVNPSPKFLARLYSDATIYWHLTGIGLNPESSPECLEHFGISVVEAMSAGCIPVAVKFGGPQEIITDSWDGFLVESAKEVKADTERLIGMGAEARKLIAERSAQTAVKYLPSVFGRRLLEVLAMAL